MKYELINIIFSKPSTTMDLVSSIASVAAAPQLNASQPIPIPATVPGEQKEQKEKEKKKTWYVYHLKLPSATCDDRCKYPFWMNSTYFDTAPEDAVCCYDPAGTLHVLIKFRSVKAPVKKLDKLKEDFGGVHFDYYRKKDIQIGELLKDLGKLKEVK